MASLQTFSYTNLPNSSQQSTVKNSSQIISKRDHSTPCQEYHCVNSPVKSWNNDNVVAHCVFDLNGTNKLLIILRHFEG